MEAVVEVNPLGGAGTYQGWQDITAQLLRGTKLTQRAERTEWNYGVIRFGDARLRLADPHGRYAPPFYSESRFAIAGQDNSLFRVRFPSVRGGVADTTIWRGLITTKASMMEWKTGESQMEARPVNAVYRESVITPGNIVLDNTVADIIAAIYNVAKINEQVGDPQTSLAEPSTARLIVANEEEITGEDFEVLAIFEKFLRPLDGLTSYDMANDRPLIFTRGTLPAGYAPVDLNRVIDVMEFSAGTEQVYNEIVIDTGLDGDDETIAERNDRSINQYGLRSAEIDLKWVRSRDVSFGIAQYLLDRLATPRQMLKVIVDAWAIPPASIFVGNHIRLNIFQNTPARGEWGGPNLRLFRNRLPTFQGVWYIEQAEWLLDADTITLTLREVR